MPAAIAMASAKPVLPSLSKASTTSLAFSTPSSSPNTSSSVSTISIPVSAFHDPSNNVITITPYIFVKTATVAEQMQALRQDKKIGKPPEQPAGALRVKRRTDLSKLGLPEAKPASVSRRNARERNRVKQVNLGFETLREHVPNGKKNKKMSKVQTLRSAAQYIKDLYMILHGELPALGSPSNVLDDHEPDSPLDNSVCSMSDNDTDMGVSSPEAKIVPLCHFMQHPTHDTTESTSLPPSPTLVYTKQVSQSSPKPVLSQPSSQSSPTIVFNQQVSQSSPTIVFNQQVSQSSPTSSTQIRQKVQPLILKKENISVLQQQLTRGLSSQPTRTTSVLKQQLQSQQHQPHQQQRQIQPQLQKQEHNEQIRMVLTQDQKSIFDLSHVRGDQLTCPTSLTPSNNNVNLIKSFLNVTDSTNAFNQLSPVSLAEEQYDNAMDMSPDMKYDTTIDLSPEATGSEHDTDPNGLGNSSMDIAPSPPTLHSYSSDFNMNRIESQADFNLLQSYYKSIRHEHLKSIDPSFSESRSSNHMGIFNVTGGLHMVHSPAPSLCSTTSTSSSETDGSVHSSYDYDNVDKEALLDISNWISELCQATHANDLGQN